MMSIVEELLGAAGRACSKDVLWMAADPPLSRNPRVDTIHSLFIRTLADERLTNEQVNLTRGDHDGPDHQHVNRQDISDRSDDRLGFGSEPR